VHEERGQKKESRDVLRQALDAKPNDRKLHYRYGKLSMEIGDVTDEQLLYHFKRAYSSGDKNYDAQVLHARQVYLTDGNQAAKPFFREMKNAKLPLRIRSAIRYPLAATFKGRVNRMEVNHCLIQVDGSGDWIYAHEDNITGGLGHEILLSSRVSFRIGFSMFGPVAFDVRAENA
jgi:hypothetical protein